MLEMQSPRFCVLVEVVKMRCEIPGVPFSAGVICLNGETQHCNKSCMKCVFRLNKTQQQNTRVQHVLHTNGYINMKEHDSVTVTTRVVMTVIVSVDPSN